MEKLLKILSILFASLFLLMLSLAIVLPLLLDPNDYKPQIIAFVKEKTGRDLEIPGSIRLSFFPWVGISTGKIVFSDSKDRPDRAFATIEQGDIKVKLIPLFTKNIQVSHIVLKGLNLNLIKNKQAINNWDDLMAFGSTATKATGSVDIKRNQPKSASASWAALAIGGITIEQARVDWDDQASGDRLILSDLNMKTGNFSFGEPVDITASFRLANSEVPSEHSINFSSRLSVDHHLEFFKFTKTSLNYARKNQEAPNRSMTATFAAVGIAFDRVKQSLAMHGIRIDSDDLHIQAELNGKQMIDSPVIQGPFKIVRFNPAQYLTHLNFKLPEMQDKQAFTRLSLQYNLLATTESAEIQRLTGQLDDTLILGNATVKNFAQPSVDFKLKLDKIDVDRYLSATRKSSKLIAAPALALASVFSKLPPDTLRQLNVNGELSVDQLKVNGLTMRGVHLMLNENRDKLAVRQSIHRIYQGSYNSQLNLRLGTGPKLMSLTEKIDQIQLEPFLNDLTGKAKINGVADASTHWQWPNLNPKELKSGLKGRIEFFLTDASIKGLNIHQILNKVLGPDPALAVLGKNEQTFFSEISGSAKLNEGIIQNNNLVAKSSRFQVDGAGSANLDTGLLDYQLTTRLKKKQTTPGSPEQFHGTPVVIRVRGTFEQPSYSVDASSLLTDKNKEKIKKLLDKKKEKVDKLLEKLDKKIGPGVSDLLKDIF